jgi:hypothetical protein
MIQAFFLYSVLLAHIPIFFSDIFHVFSKCLGRLIKYIGGWVGYGVKRHFQQHFSYIAGVSFISGRNRRKPPTCLKSLTIFIFWWPVLSVEETEVPGENHRSAASHWQTILIQLNVPLMIQAFLLYSVLLAHIPIFFSDIFHVFSKCLGRLITYNSSQI